MARGGVELRPFDAGAAPTIAAHCEDVDAASLRKLRWLVRDVQRLGSPSPRVDALLAAAATLVNARSAVAGHNAARLGRVLRKHASVVDALGDGAPEDLRDAAADADAEVARLGRALARHAKVLEDRARDDLPENWHETDDTWRMIEARRVDPDQVLTTRRVDDAPLLLVVTVAVPGAHAGYETRDVVVRGADDDEVYGLEFGFQMLAAKRAARERAAAAEAMVFDVDAPRPATERASAARPSFFDPMFSH